ncbi:MAG TPA: LEA type 2 family protein [Casimicrobiaceae bacterium]
MRTLVVAASSSLLLASACTSMRPKIEPPQIALESVRIVRIAEAKADISVGLKLANRSDVQIAIDTLELDLALDGRPAVSGRSVRVGALPPGGEARVDLGGRVDLAAVANALMTLGSQLPVPYELKGTVTLEDGTALAFSRKGEIPVARFDRALGSRP